MKKIKDYISLMRVKHYIKNILIFFPLVFSGNLFNVKLLEKSFFAFIAFSLAASLVYILNDIHDCEKDKLHPTKCQRPIASGRVSKKEAYCLSTMLLILVILINELLVGTKVTLLALILFYIFINIIYSMGGIKDLPIWDLAILTLGYVIRVYYGANTIDVEVSIWMSSTVIFMATFLGLGKRRNEIKFQGSKTRKVLSKYTVGFLDKNMYVCLGMTLASYTLWCKEMAIQSNSTLCWILCVGLALLICMRYSMLVEREQEGDPISVLFGDKEIIILVFVWGCIMLLTLYWL